MEKSRRDLGRALASKFGWAEQQGKEVIDEVFELIAGGLETGDSFRLIRFGVFETVLKPPQKGHNPANGAPLEIPEHRVVKFRASGGLKRAVGARGG